MKFLNKYIKKYWKPFLLAVAFLTFETTCDLMQPTIMSKIVDVGVAKKDLNYVLKLGGLMLLVTLFGALSATSRNIISSRVSQKFGAELRLDLFKKIQSLSFDNLDNFERASLITRLTNDVNQVQIFVNGLMRIFVKAPLIFIGSIIMALRLNFRLAWIILIIVPLVSLIIFFNMKISYPFFIKVQKALDKVNSVIREYLSGVRVVKAFNNFNYEMKKFNKANEALSKESITAMRVTSIFSPAITLTVNLGTACLIWLGGINVNSGNAQIGQIMAFINYMTQILFSLMMISFVLTMFIKAKASAKRIEEVFEEVNTMKTKETSVKVSSPGSISFEKVCFSYTGAKGDPVLKDISFNSMPGETIGIIGSTGSGKTSLINLIPRFYDATLGSVKLGGIDVKEISLEKLREGIALVPQKSVLFTGTVLDNIRWGKEDASLEEVIKAAKIAQAQDFISTMPEGYNTMVGQGGVNFSGGQKQRLCIARALIKNPDILILDDSTSALDATTESKIRRALKEYSKKLTTIIISQKITSVMEADKIIVLDNGNLVGIGTHEVLMNSCSIYQEIFYSQLGKEVI